MTENELRQKVARQISGWKGAKQGSKVHHEIIDLYNSQRPLPSGYKVTYSDAWCAATASAAYYAVGITAYTGSECSCSRWIALAKQNGIWREDDSYVPKVGDACFYDWQDSGKGDNTGAPDHVGIVTQAGSKSFIVTEGNKGKPSHVADRTMEVNGRYIRGFLTPNFAAAAKALTEEREDNMTGQEIYQALSEYLATQGAPNWARDELAEAIELGITDGVSPCSFVPRYQAAIMALRAYKKAKEG